MAVVLLDVKAKIEGKMKGEKRGGIFFNTSLLNLKTVFYIKQRQSLPYT